MKNDYLLDKVLEKVRLFLNRFQFHTYDIMCIDKLEYRYVKNNMKQYKIVKPCKYTKFHKSTQHIHCR
jgi:hypothetical protein